ncbi:cupin domain-containing protein [Methylophaga sp.]|uniref:cupin domain-containing protein n=1 Tax=Methylophaga sp. TaxID=2024840 RepID=UPI002721526F|nr:cupin domain-containing protein [Methylophaga sp.]MDO8826223.1 cupin domain-containing protein [Methylophaga sp.]
MMKKDFFAVFLLNISLAILYSPVVKANDITHLLSQQLQAPFNEEVEMITVRYAPGESTSPHRHNAHTLVYVLAGTVEMQVEGGDIIQLHAGETFYESPEDIHLISRNASKEHEAVFLVVFIKTQGANTVIPLNE